MAKKKAVQPKAIRNKRASFDYDLTDSWLAGIVLTGAETKALRMGHGHLRGAYVTVQNSELFLFNATITGFNGVKLDETEQTRSRKLLMKRKEINNLMSEKQQGRSIIPVQLLTGGRYIKVRISIGTGKKRYDKRETIKRRDQDRAAQMELKNR